MTKSSGKKRKNQKKSKKSPLPKEAEQAPVIDAAPYWLDDERDVYVREEAEKDCPDGVRLIDSCPSCVEPEVYESFNDGKKIVISVGNDKKCFEVVDTGSGMTYKYFSDSREQRIDYATLSFLIVATQMMQAMGANIYGGSWWVDHKGRIGDVNKTLQNLSEDYKNKEHIVNKDEW